MPCIDCKDHRTLAAIAIRALQAEVELDEHIEGCQVCLKGEECSEFDLLHDKIQLLRHDALCEHTEHMDFWAARFKIADDLIGQAVNLAEATLAVAGKSKTRETRQLRELATRIITLFETLSKPVTLDDVH